MIIFITFLNDLMAIILTDRSLQEMSLIQKAQKQLVYKLLLTGLLKTQQKSVHESEYQRCHVHLSPEELNCLSSQGGRNILLL